jgi:hypothetical protein
MNSLKKLKDWSARQDALTGELRTLLAETEGSDTLQELERLKSETARLVSDAELREQKLKKLSGEVTDLRSSLNEQILDERLQILKISKRQTDLYFKKASDETDNSLKRLEASAVDRLNELKRRAGQELGKKGAAIRAEIARLENDLRAALKEKREQLREEEKALYAEIASARGDMESEPLSEETVKERVRQNRLEMKIGAGWLGRIGILLIIVAVALFAWWKREYIGAFARSAAIFAAGLLMLGFGELLYRKKVEPFHKLLLGGGIAILFIGVFFSHFLLKTGGVPVMNMMAALGFSVGISLAALVLSVRYNSRTIIVFAAVGGYLPFITYLVQFGFTGSQYYWAMGYLTLLNILVLTVGILKDWRITSWLLFFLNAPSISFLVLDAPSPAVGLIFTTLTFALYAFSVFSRPLFLKKGLKAADLVLLGLNTTVSAVLLWVLFRKLEWLDFDGLLALGLAVIYAVGAILIARYRREEKNSSILLYLTAITFAVLVIPFQFGAMWLTLGWLVQAVLLVLFGYKRNIRWATITGWALLGLCAGTFLIIDVFRGIDTEELFNQKVGIIPLFDLKFLVLVAAQYGLSLFFAAEMNAGRLSEFSRHGRFLRAMRIISQLNLVPFALYLVISWYIRIVFSEEFFDVDLPDWAGFLGLFAVLALTLRGAAVLTNGLKIFKDKVTPWLATATLLFGDLLVVIATVPKELLPLEESGDAVLKGFGLAVLILLNLGILWDARRILYIHFKRSGQRLELFPMIIALIATEQTTLLILCHLTGSAVSLILSLCYLIIAVLAIIYGFVKRYLYVRFVGLGLIAVSMIILFVNVFRAVDIPGKIATFLVFGVVLLGLSYGYHKISKRMEKKETPDAPK